MEPAASCPHGAFQQAPWLLVVQTKCAGFKWSRVQKVQGGGRKMHVNWPATLANRAVLALTEINERQ